MTAVTPMIEANRPSKVFQDRRQGEIRAVDDISMRILPGEIYGLLGANGAGKTTFMRLLATLIAPTSGSASVAGFDCVRESDQVRGRVGFLAASSPLYGRLTAREIISYFGELNGLSRDAVRARVAMLADELGMREFLDRRTGGFSTGMKQKTSIARTVAHDPTVIILDEPTSGLDVTTARSIYRFVRDCRARGKTVIYSTHLLHEAESLCDRIGIIHGGRLMAEGTAQALKQSTGKATLEAAFLTVVGQGGDEP